MPPVPSGDDALPIPGSRASGSRDVPVSNPVAPSVEDQQSWLRAQAEGVGRSNPPGVSQRHNIARAGPSVDADPAGEVPEVEVAKSIP